MAAEKRGNRRGKKAGQRVAGIRLLLGGLSAREVAEALSVGTRTVETWKASDAFAEALAANDAEQAAGMASDAERLNKLATRGIDSLEKLLDGIKALEPSDQVRLVAEVRQWTIGNKHRVAGDPDNPTPVDLAGKSDAEILEMMQAEMAALGLTPPGGKAA